MGYKMNWAKAAQTFGDYMVDEAKESNKYKREQGLLSQREAGENERARKQEEGLNTRQEKANKYKIDEEERAKKQKVAELAAAVSAELSIGKLTDEEFGGIGGKMLSKEQRATLPTGGDVKSGYDLIIDKARELSGGDDAATSELLRVYLSAVGASREERKKINEENRKLNNDKLLESEKQRNRMELEGKKQTGKTLTEKETPDQRRDREIDTAEIKDVNTQIRELEKRINYPNHRDNLVSDSSVEGGYRPVSPKELSELKKQRDQLKLDKKYLRDPNYIPEKNPNIVTPAQKAAQQAGQTRQVPPAPTGQQPAPQPAPQSQPGQGEFITKSGRRAKWVNGQAVYVQ